MKEKILVLVALVMSFGIGFMVGEIVLIKTQKINPILNQVVDRSLDKYTIDNLSKVQINTPSFQVIKVLKDYPKFTSNEFSLEFDPTLQNGTTKKVSGLLNVPKDNNKHPLIVMLRGYVAVKDYFIGNGTINASLFFAKNGFITASPDFLGYGNSDGEPANIFEARFQTYTTAMALLKSIDLIPNWDHKNVFIWAHSNGGNIALTTLEITNTNYPTVLWAPVSASFPFSILYYSDEVADKGKFIRKSLSQFEDVYDANLYSLANYLDRIKAPIQLNQGTSDDAVPISWSDSLAEILKKQGLNLNYNKYPGADHLMSPVWNSVIEKDLEFFRENVK